MKVLLEIPDNKAASLMDVLRSIPYVKAETIIEPNSLLLVDEIKDAIEELKLIKKGELTGIPAKQLLDEL